MAQAAHGAQAITHQTGPLAHLSSCIASVDLACRTLETSNTTLAEQTSDFARLAAVVRSKRHFDLVSETEIRHAREHLQAEIAPQLKELILRAEAALQQDERKTKALRSKAAQQQARLEQLAQLHHISVDELKGKQDRGGDDDLGSQHSARPEKSMGQRGDPWLLNEVQRLRDKAATMQQQRRAMQREMAQLEREVAGTRR